MASTRDQDYRDALAKLRGSLFPQNDGNRTPTTMPRTRGESLSFLDLQSGPRDNRTVLPMPAHPARGKTGSPTGNIPDPLTTAEKQQRVNAYFESRQSTDSSPLHFDSTWENFRHHRDAILDALEDGNSRCPLYSCTSEDLSGIYLAHMDEFATVVVLEGDPDSTFPQDFLPPRPRGIIIFQQTGASSSKTSRDAVVWETDTFGGTDIAFLSKKKVGRGSAVRLSYAVDVLLRIHANGILTASTLDEARTRVGARERVLAAFFLNAVTTVQHRIDTDPDRALPEAAIVAAVKPKVWRFDRNTPRVVMMSLVPGQVAGVQRQFNGYSRAFTVNEFYRNQACGPGWTEHRRVKVRKHVRAKGAGIVDDRPIIYRYR